MKLTIGKLAQLSNVTVETVRYYQRKELIDEPAKPLTGYRQYPQEVVDRIRFIKRAQKFGFTLKEIAELLSLDGKHCKDVQEIAEQKCQQIDQQLKDLVALRNALDTLVKNCRKNQSTQHCSLINTLSNQTDTTGQSH